MSSRIFTAVVAPLLLGVFTAIVVNFAVVELFQTWTLQGEDVRIPMETFDGAQWSTPNTRSAVTLASNKYGQFQVHSVLTDKGTIADNWLWTNDRDQVNIFVRIFIAFLSALQVNIPYLNLKIQVSSNKFLITRENRYGLKSESYSAPNGYVRKNETAMEAAKRVLRESIDIVSSSISSMGVYRIQVNRGGGFLHMFYANDVTFSDQSLSTQRLRRKKYKKIYLVTKDELLDILSRKLDPIGEIQWAATLGMGILQLT